MSSPLVFIGVCFARRFIFCVVLCSSLFVLFSFGHCIVYSSFMYSMRWWCSLCTRSPKLNWVFIMLADWNNSPQLDMSFENIIPISNLSKSLECSSCAVDHECEPRSGQTKDYKIDICCFSAKHTAFMLYTSPWSRFEPKISVMIGTDCIGSCKSNYHTIMPMTAPLTFGAPVGSNQRL
jgi:hypothetical protein